MLVDIIELPLAETARFNPGQLEAFCGRMGEVRSEHEVARALDRLSNRLSQVARLRKGGDMAVLDRAVGALVRDATLIGMATLARVGADVLECIRSDDQVALSATLARLDRVGDRSIHAVWDLEDISG
ncbi:MAG: hypothetical protein RIB61_04055 [Roseicyclus sp.]